jgi:hypothetical protein
MIFLHMFSTRYGRKSLSSEHESLDEILTCFHSMQDSTFVIQIESKIG